MFTKVNKQVCNFLKKIEPSAKPDFQLVDRLHLKFQIYNTNKNSNYNMYCPLMNKLISLNFAISEKNYNARFYSVKYPTFQNLLQMSEV